MTSQINPTQSLYTHLDWQGQKIHLAIGKVVCIGQNYLDHIQEMQSKTAADPLFFLKPSTALRHFTPQFSIPQHLGEVHHETEIAVLIGQPLQQATEAEVSAAIWGYSLALDLTLREVQAQLKQLGRPWDIAKGFDGACPIAGFVPAALIPAPEHLKFQLKVNGQLRQQGDASMMIRSICRVIAQMSHWFSLQPGDVILTGTPAGVGPLHVHDQLELQLSTWFSQQAEVVLAPSRADGEVFQTLYGQQA